VKKDVPGTEQSRDPLQHDGIITIGYKRLPEPDEEEGQGFVWEYRADPPISDELAARLLREVADRL
jgi:hypothetical protein